MRVLLVEDDARLRETLCASLQEAGYVALTPEKLQESLDLVKE